MIAIVGVIDDGRNPDGVETKFLNIIKVVLDAFESSTTVSVDVSTRRRVATGSRESVSNYLVNNA